jgi:translation initiation factor 5B
MPPKKVAAKPALTGVAALKARVQAQQALEEKLKKEAEEQARREEEERRKEEEARKWEEEQRKIQEELDKKEKVAGKKVAAQKDNEEQIRRWQAAGMEIDLEALEAARAGKLVAEASKPAPRPKRQHPAGGGAAAASSAAAAAKKSETMDELTQKRDAVIARNEARTTRRAERAARKAAEAEAAEAERKKQAEAEGAEKKGVLELRSPICCVLGHVDTGKTSLLDRIRRTNVQGGEAGGITQQIGATFFPHDALFSATEELNKRYKYDLRVPGLLVIDTPGHESFTNLRSRGSTLCDIAVLVIDIMHGLEPQTRESIKLLRDRRCPFIVALNKIDRCLDWEAHENMDAEQTLEKQKAHTRNEFETRSAQVIAELNAEGLNAEIYWRNKDVRKYISLVPTSAKTGEGIADLLLLKVELCQRFLEGKVAFKNDLQCTVLEVKPVQGIGTTIDAVLVNGILHEGDKIVCCGLNGPIETQIRSLLTPQPMRELRVKSEYIHHKELRAAMGVKICATDLEEVVPGTPMFVWKTEEERQKARKDVMSDLGSILQQIDKTGVGVTVQSSTLGALEALLSFLKDSDIPVSAIALGPLHKKHLQHTLAMRARQPRFAVVLAFDVPISKEAQEFATKEKLPIFEAKIIYHLFDMFTKYLEKCDAEQMEKDKQVAVFPVVIEGLTSIRDRPMILQGTITKGHFHVGTPLCTVYDEGGQKMKLPIGTVVSIQKDGKDIKNPGAGVSVAFKVVPANSSLHFSRQFGERNTLYSDITRESIDALKTSFLKEVPRDDWDLIRDLKPVLGIAGPAKKD